MQFLFLFLFKLANCQDLFERGCISSGIYTINPWSDLRSLDVICDMETSDGGWIVLQRRFRGSISFNKSWNQYKIGFGSLNETFWIGNEVIHQFTRNENVTLYVAIKLVNGTTFCQEYRRFSVADESDKFRLFLQGPEPNGTLGDSMVNTTHSFNKLHGMPFPTYDQNNHPHSHCGSSRGCGWWLNFCAYAVFNGPWEDYAWVFVWYHVVPNGMYVRGTLMMIRPN